MSSNLQIYVVPILNGASLFGRIIPGALADKLGRFNMMCMMSLFTTIVVFTLWIPAKNNAVVLVFAAFYGFGSGSFVSIFPTLIGEITKDVSKLGKRNGAAFCVLGIAALIGSPIGGALIKADGGRFLGVQLFAGLCLAVGTAIFCMARTSLVGLKIVKV
jgi:MFS family permease